MLGGISWQQPLSLFATAVASMTFWISRRFQTAADFLKLSASPFARAAKSKQAIPTPQTPPWPLGATGLMVLPPIRSTGYGCQWPNGFGMMV